MSGGGPGAPRAVEGAHGIVVKVEAEIVTIRFAQAVVGPWAYLHTFTAERCSWTRFLVLAGTAGAGRLTPTVSTRISGNVGPEQV